MKKLTAIVLLSITTLSLLGCSKEEIEVSFEPSEIIAEMETTVPEEEQVAMMELDDTMLETLYGMDATMLDSYVARFPIMNVQCEEYFIAKVTEGNMEAVKELLEARQKALVEEWGMYLPDQVELIENYQLIEQEDYILFAIGYNAETLAEIFQAKFN